MPSNRKRLLIAGGAIALLAGGAVLWHEVLEERFIPKRFGVVEEALVFRSGQLHAALVGETLRAHGVRLVLDLTGPQSGDADQAAEIAACQALGIEHVKHPLRGDGTGDVASYVAAMRRLVHARRQKTPVLVHCAAGSQRTGGVIALYRVLVQGWTTDAAEREMAAYDWRPSDDRALPLYLNAHLPEIVDALVADGLLARRPDPLPVFPVAE